MPTKYGKRRRSHNRKITTMMNAPHTVYFFSNGSAICIDAAGNQMPELYDNLYTMYLSCLEAVGIDIEKIPTIRTVVNGHQCKIIATKTA